MNANILVTSVKICHNGPQISPSNPCFPPPKCWVFVKWANFSKKWGSSTYWNININCILFKEILIWVTSRQIWNSFEMLKEWTVHNFNVAFIGFGSSRLDLFVMNLSWKTTCMKKFIGTQKLKTGAMHKEPFYFTVV